MCLCEVRVLFAVPDLTSLVAVVDRLLASNLYPQALNVKKCIKCILQVFVSLLLFLAVSCFSTRGTSSVFEPRVVENYGNNETVGTLNALRMRKPRTMRKANNKSQREGKRCDATNRGKVSARSDADILCRVADRSSCCWGLPVMSAD